MSELVLFVRPCGARSFTVELTRLVERAAAMARALEWTSDEQEFLELLADLAHVGDADVETWRRRE